MRTQETQHRGPTPRLIPMVGNDSCPEKPDWDINRLIDRFFESQDVKSSSRYSYRRSLRQFIAWIKTTGVISPCREDILAFKRSLVAQKLSALTISNYLVVVRKFFEWTEGERLYPNIARGIKGMKRAHGFKKDSLTIEQTLKLLSGTTREGLVGLRDYAILNLLVRTGIRTIELMRSNIEDIRQEGGEAVLWIQGKGRDNKDEFVLLTGATILPINEYLTARGRVSEKEPLFVSHSNRSAGRRLSTRMVSLIVKRRLVEIGLNSARLTAHSLRHTAITISLQGGASIQEARALARHSDINTTLVYAHNIDRIVNAPERKIDEVLKVQD